MYIYSVNRAFQHDGETYKKLEEISEAQYESLGVNQVFVTKSWEGTHEELEAFLAAKSKKSTKATKSSSKDKDSYDLPK